MAVDLIARALAGEGGGGGYELPTASTNTLGGVKIDGTSITISNQVISATDELPADPSTDGTYKLVNTVETTNGTQTATQTWEEDSEYTLPTASTSTLGGVKIDGDTITITDGVISAADELPADPVVDGTYKLVNTVSTTGGTQTATQTWETDSGGGSSYTFTNGLSESSGVVSWDLNSSIKAGTGTNSLILSSYALARATGTNTICMGDTLATNNNALSQGGGMTQASGTGALATGFGVQATGEYSHAQGEESVASGAYSHAEGAFTKTSSQNQHAEGRANIVDSHNVFQHIVGNGTNNVNRSNAAALDWTGNQYLSGNLYVGCNNYTTTSSGISVTNCGGSKVATESYVDTKIPTAPVNDGTYMLKCVVSSGTPTYSWESVTVGGSY